MTGQRIFARPRGDEAAGAPLTDDHRALIEQDRQMPPPDLILPAEVARQDVELGGETVEHVEPVDDTQLVDESADEVEHLDAPEQEAIEAFGLSALDDEEPPPFVDDVAEVVADLQAAIRDEVRMQLEGMIDAVAAQAVQTQLEAFKREVADELAKIRHLENMTDPQKVAAAFAQMESRLGTLAQHVTRTSGIPVPGF